MFLNHPNSDSNLALAFRGHSTNKQIKGLKQYHLSSQVLVQFKPMIKADPAQEEDVKDALSKVD